MPRTLPAALTTAMDSGIYEPYIRVYLGDDATEVGQVETQPLAFTLGPTSASITVPFPSTIDPSFFRIVRGAIINGTPSTISSIWFKIRRLQYDGIFANYQGEALSDSYLSVAANSDYQTVIGAALLEASAGIDIVPNYEGAAAWKAYQFYPDGKEIILNTRKSLFALLQQKYLVFAAEDGWNGTDNNMFFFVSTQTRAQDYELTDQLFNYSSQLVKKRLVWRDEVDAVHTLGSVTDPIHNLGYLESTALDPYDPTPGPSVVIHKVGSRSSKLPVHLKYRTGDSVFVNQDANITPGLMRIRVTEILDTESTPAWYQIIEAISPFDPGGTTDTTIVSTTRPRWLPTDKQLNMPRQNIRSAPLADELYTGRFTGALSEYDTSVQEALESLDDHNHGVLAPIQAPTATNDFLVGEQVTTVWTWVKKTLAQTVTILRTSLDSVYSLTTHTHEVDQRSDMFLDSEGDPAAIGTAADGTSTYAARRDHVHAKGSHTHKYSDFFATHLNFATVAAGATQWASPFLGATASEAGQLVLKAGTAKNFTVRTGTAQPGTGSLVFMVRKNGADTALTFTIAAGGAAGNYADNTNTVSFAAGDRVAFRIVNNASSASAQIAPLQVEFEFDTA